MLWGKTAESLNEYLIKGKQIYVEGRLQTRQWDDKDGNKRYTTEIRGDRIVLLSGGGMGRAGGGGGRQQPAQRGGRRKSTWASRAPSSPTTIFRSRGSCQVASYQLTAGAARASCGCVTGSCKLTIYFPSRSSACLASVASGAAGYLCITVSKALRAQVRLLELVVGQSRACSTRPARCRSAGSPRSPAGTR